MDTEKDSVKAMEESFAMISLEEEEQGGITYEENVEDLSEIDTRWCLIGRFLTDSPIDFQAMQHKMASLWRPGRGMYVKQLEPNRFLFQFYHEIDIKRVIDGSPWTCGRFHLILERLKEGENPKTIAINKLDVWVQLYDMETGFMSQRVVKDIGDYVGTFIESDANNFVGVWREYLRIRVTISLEGPLKRRMKLRKNAANWCWVNFKYEGIPTFCFICGMVGHGEKFCARIFNTPIDKIEKPYGAWMRADPRRRSYTSGSKWLRMGGVAPVSTTVATSGDSVTEIVAMEIRKGEKSGIISIRDKQDMIMDTGGNQGVTAGLVNKPKNLSAKIQENVSQEIVTAAEVENSELIIVDPKRRRTDQENGPNEEANISKDVVMRPQEEQNQNQKNAQLAGAAWQTRHSS